MSLCSIEVKNGALSLSLVGHTCSRIYKHHATDTWWLIEILKLLCDSERSLFSIGMSFVSEFQFGT